MRGMVFSAEAAAALALCLAIVTACLVHMRADDSSHRWLVRISHDIGLSLERSGALCATNTSRIDDEVSLLRPQNCNVSVEVLRFAPSNGSLHLYGIERHGVPASGDSTSADVLAVDSYGNVCLGRVRAGIR